MTKWKSRRLKFLVSYFHFRVWTSQQILEAGVEAKILPQKTPREMWKGVDIHLPLVWHIVQGRVPGSLPPVKPVRDYKSNGEGSSNRGKPFNRGKSFRGRGRGKFNKGRGNSIC
jgi:hypothetical protein